MAPRRDKRQFNLAASLRPRVTTPDTLTGYIESIKYAQYTGYEDYTTGEEYTEDGENTTHDENTQHEEYILHEEYTQYEEYSQYEEYTEGEEHVQDGEQNENTRQDLRNGEALEGHIFRGKYGWYTIRTDEEADIERGLLTPQAVLMKRKMRTFTRAEALELYQPIAEKFRGSYGTANVQLEVRDAFTEETVRVLPPHEKKLLLVNAKFHGDKKIARWFRDDKEKEDLQEIAVEEEHEVPCLAPKQVEDTWEDLHYLAFNSTVYLQSRLELRTTVLKMLFDEQAKRIRELEEELNLKNATVETGVDEAAGGGLEISKTSVRHGMKYSIKAFVKRAFCHRR
ncbi:hypothetical protein GGI35DRAFT_492792 [Trichoderma velutinum]